MTAGLYLHVPYCRRVCPYCDFNVVRVQRPPWPALGAALRHEMASRAAVMPGPLRSVYFGGGTPSLAPATWLVAQLEAVRAHWTLLADAEVTLELEPATLGTDDLRLLRAAGFNRISMGWQSTHPHLLRTLGRGHTAADAAQALQDARAAGFDNISLDLMFAVPTQTLGELLADLSAVRAAAVPHVSLYNLTYHAGTPFARRRARGQLQVAPEALEVEMLDAACVALQAGGWTRYEVSSFARAGARAVHNAGYWSHVPYLGLGPGAHSFIRTGTASAWRWENVRRPSAYLAAWQAPQASGLPLPDTAAASFVERLGGPQMVLERMLLGLRTTDGVALDDALLRPYAAQMAPAIAVLRQRQWAELHGHRLVPTHLGLRHADAAASLFA